MKYTVISKTGQLIWQTEETEELRRWILGQVGQWKDMLLVETTKIRGEDTYALEEWIAGRLFEKDQEVSTFWSDEKLKAVCAMFAGGGRDGFISYPPLSRDKEGFIGLHLNVLDIPLKPGEEFGPFPQTFQKACEKAEFSLVLAFKKKETIKVLLDILQTTYDHWEDYDGSQGS